MINHADDGTNIGITYTNNAHHFLFIFPFLQNIITIAYVGFLNIYFLNLMINITIHAKPYFMYPLCKGNWLFLT